MLDWFWPVTYKLIWIFLLEICFCVPVMLWTTGQSSKVLNLLKVTFTDWIFLESNSFINFFFQFTDIIRQFNPSLKGAQTSESKDNFDHHLNVAFLGASARFVINKVKKKYDNYTIKFSLATVFYIFLYKFIYAISRRIWFYFWHKF